MGNKIPLTALFGKFHWTPVLGGGAQVSLHGRTELASRKAERASSFSCAGDCPYQSWYYPYFDDNVPWGNYPIPDLQDALEATMHDDYTDAYGNSSSNSMPAGSMTPYGTNDSSILAATSINSDYTLRMDTGNGGTTQFYYFFHAKTASGLGSHTDNCTVEDDGGDEGGAATVQIPTSTQFNYVITNGPNNCDSGFAGSIKIESRYIADQNGNLIAAQQYWQENVILDTTHNQLGFKQSDIQQMNVNTSTGFYSDRLTFCSSACLTNPSAQTWATQYQTVTLNNQNYTLVPNKFVYSCSKNTINGQ